MWAAKPTQTAHIADGVLEDQVPADDPGDEFAHGGVGVGVGAAGDGDHGGEFGVAEAGEAADDGDEDEARGRGRGRRRGGRAIAEWWMRYSRSGRVEDRRRLSNFWPAMAVPMTVKMPEPMTAPMPRAVRETGPRVFLRACSGRSESAMSLSIDFVAKICRAKVGVVLQHIGSRWVAAVGLLSSMT